jgi:hypothetical protein
MSLAEFSLNSAVSDSTGFSPLKLMYGYEPLTPVEAIATAQQQQATQANKHRRDATFAVGDLVHLSTANFERWLVPHVSLRCAGVDRM